MSALSYIELDTERGKRIIGHEVISSGLANSIVGAATQWLLGVLTDVGGSKFIDERLRAHPRGNIEGTSSFAEIAIRPNDEPRPGAWAFDVDVIFYPGADWDDEGSLFSLSMVTDEGEVPPTQALPYKRHAQMQDVVEGESRPQDGPTMRTMEFIRLKYNEDALDLACGDKGGENMTRMHDKDFYCNLTDEDPETLLANDWYKVFSTKQVCRPIAPVEADEQDLCAE